MPDRCVLCDMTKGFVVMSRLPVMALTETVKKKAFYRGLEDDSDQHFFALNMHHLLDALKEIYLILKLGKCFTSLIQKRSSNTLQYSVISHD